MIFAHLKLSHTCILSEGKHRLRKQLHKDVSALGMSIHTENLKCILESWNQVAKESVHPISPYPYFNQIKWSK